MSFRIATFNVNSVRSRLPILERWLPTAGVDLLCMQETKVVDADFPAAAFEALGYKTYFHGEKSYNGVALASRYPLKDVRFGFGDGEEPSFDTRVVRARLNDIVVLNTYVPQGKEITHPDYGVKKRFLDRVRALFDMEQLQNVPFVWLGDINVAPADADVTNPQNKKEHVCFHHEIREKFESVCSWGLTDLLRRFHPEAGVYTFFDYRVKDALSRNIGWRIDHILANAALAGTARDCFVETAPRGWERPSDHTPLVADFEIALP